MLNKLPSSKLHFCMTWLLDQDLPVTLMKDNFIHVPSERQKEREKPPQKGFLQNNQ
jgi:hypothetical protein